jgi:dihydroorotase
LNLSWTVHKENILSKCGWSPLEGTAFQTKVIQTFVNGNLVYDNGVFNENSRGKALTKNN